MAYCVHCGVKLHDAEKKCPLCGTVIVDPQQPDRAAEKPYPTHTPEQVLKRNRRYLLSLAALLTLLPAAVCALTDLIASPGTLTWSVYPAAALVLLFVAFAVPVLSRKYRTYKSLLVDFLTISAYLFMVERLSGSGDWFFPVALPCFALFVALTAILLILYRADKLNKLTFVAAALIAVAVQCGLTEWIICLSEGVAMRFAWSPYIVAPCLFLGFVFFLINGNRLIREEFRRRVHF